MPVHYLRVEAVNLGNSVYDTEDLSTIRGSGLMILKLQGPVVEAIRQSTASGIPLVKASECVSHGASQVVFRVELIPGAKADDLVKAVSDFLRKDAQLKFATLVVSISDRVYDSAREALLANNRFRQLRQLRVSPAGLFPKIEDQLEPVFPWCTVDMVRPATSRPPIRNPEKKAVGESVMVRRSFGHDQKQKFYEETAQWKPDLGRGKTVEAAWDFHQIGQFDETAREAAEREVITCNLNDKIAVIYVDGNSFRKKQAGFCVDESNQKEFDKQVQSRQLDALKRILDQAWKTGSKSDPLWWNVEKTKENGEIWRHRLETLLWGGDEVLWVVPAWFGLSTLQAFFDVVDPPKDDDLPRAVGMLDQKRSMRILDQSAGKPKSTLAAQHYGRLTYSAGLVLCHAEAPIQGVIQLAKDLAEECKRYLKAKNAQDNLFAHAVLESFDQLGDEVHRARRAHLPFPAGTADDDKARLEHLLISHGEMKKLLPAVCWMREHFPRGSVYQILRALRTTDDHSKLDSPFARLFVRALRDAKSEDLKDAETKGLLDVFDLRNKQGRDSDARRVNWFHLAELWDYAREEVTALKAVPH